jgi:Cu/Ag efflux pump CusA
MIGDLTSAPEPVVIKLFSQDPKVLDQWAPRVGNAIKKVAGVVLNKTLFKQLPSYESYYHYIYRKSEKYYA